MKRLPTVLLHHETTHGSHYDWLLGNPWATTKLWAARTRVDSSAWAKIRVWTLWRMAPHRRYYLKYQGALAPKSGRRRGQVRQVDSGWLVPKIWTDDRIVMDVLMKRFKGRVQICFLGQDHYRAVVMGDGAEGGSSEKI